MENEELVERAGKLYEAYCEAVGGKAFNGDPLPSFEEIRNDPNKETVVKGWVAVASKGAELSQGA